MSSRLGDLKVVDSVLVPGDGGGIQFAVKSNNDVVAVSAINFLASTTSGESLALAFPTLAAGEAAEFVVHLDCANGCPSAFSVKTADGTYDNVVDCLLSDEVNPDDTGIYVYTYTCFAMAGTGSLPNLVVHRAGKKATV